MSFFKYKKMTFIFEIMINKYKKLDINFKNYKYSMLFYMFFFKKWILQKETHFILLLSHKIILLRLNKTWYEDSRKNKV